MGVIKNDVGRPSNKTIMIRNIIKGVCLLVVIALAFFVGYKYKDSNKVTNKNVSKKTNINNTNVDLVEAKSIVDSIFIPTGVYSEYNFYDVNSNEYKTAVAIEHANKSNNNYGLKEVLESTSSSYSYDILKDLIYKIVDFNDVKKEFDKIFENGDVLKKNIDLPGEGCKNIIYSSKYNVYVAVDGPCGDPGKIVYGVYKASKNNNNEYTIIVCNGYINSPDENNLNPYYIDIDGNKVKYDWDMSDEDDKKFIIDNGSKMTQYELIFKKQKDSFKFISGKTIQIAKN